MQNLGESLRAPRFRMEDLNPHSLPNPTLALATGQEERLQENLRLIDQRCTPSPEGRLVVAIDCTYLLRSFSQMSMSDSHGLVGGAWSSEKEESAFIAFDSEAMKQRTNANKAALMCEFLVWDPKAAHRQAWSCASMPLQRKTMPTHRSKLAIGML